MSFISNNRISLATLLCALTMHSALVSAEPEQGKRRGPPPEALNACADAQEGDSCSFTGRQEKELTGTCIVPPRNREILVCLPEGHRQHKAGQEARQEAQQEG